MARTITASTQGPQIQNYIRGDSRLLVIPVYQADGQTPFDLTGCEVFITLNASQNPADDGTDVTAVLKKSVSSGFVDIYTSLTLNLAQASVPYIAQIQLLNTDTQPLAPDVYFYDIQLKDSTGNITSLSQNTWSIISDITTRIV